ncbi:MAG: hypothetical protein K0M55_10950 [Rhizobium sp.]|nr:hypothetical protein [Rhizobium sp.]
MHQAKSRIGVEDDLTELGSSSIGGNQMGWLDVFIIAVGCLGVLSVALSVWSEKAISTGHAISVCAGVVLIVLPVLSSFEFTGDGVKFTRRSETIELTDQVTALTKQNARLREDLQRTIEGLQATSERLRAIETSAQSSGATPLPDSSDAWLQTIKPAFFEDLKASNEEGVRAAEKTLQSLQKFNGQLEGSMYRGIDR